MFLASQMQSILDQVSKLAEKLNIPTEYRDAVVMQVESNPSYTPRFRVSVGEIHWGGSYAMEFTRDKLQAVYQERWTEDGKIESKRIVVVG